MGANTSEFDNTYFLNTIDDTVLTKENWKSLVNEGLAKSLAKKVG